MGTHCCPEVCIRGRIGLDFAVAILFIALMILRITQIVQSSDVQNDIVGAAAFFLQCGLIRLSCTVSEFRCLAYSFRNVVTGVNAGKLCKCISWERP